MAEWNAAKSQSRLGAEVIRLVSGRLSRKGVSADDWGRWAEKSIMVKLMSVVMKMSGGKRVVNEPENHCEPEPGDLRITAT